MTEHIYIQILRKIKKAGRGTLFFAGDFGVFGSDVAIRKALERLVKTSELDRVAFGIYVRPKTDNFIGKLTPGIEDIAKAIAKRDRARIVPTGAYALNRLGLSTQVPLRVVYLTDGAARKIKIKNRTITFKKATPKNVVAVGEISRLAIQALRTIGKKNVTEDEMHQIRQLLMKEKKTKLEHDARLAPAWIREIFKSIIKERADE
jgi:hypothetical protein